MSAKSTTKPARPKRRNVERPKPAEIAKARREGKTWNEVREHFGIKLDAPAPAPRPSVPRSEAHGGEPVPRGRPEPPHRQGAPGPHVDPHDRGRVRPPALERGRRARGRARRPVPRRHRRQRGRAPARRRRGLAVAERTKPRRLRGSNGERLPVISRSYSTPRRASRFVRSIQVTAAIGGTDTRSEAV